MGEGEIQVATALTAHLHEAAAQRIEKREIDPSYIISHCITLEEAPRMYEIWRDKEEAVTKIVIDPWAEANAA